MHKSWLAIAGFAVLTACNDRPAVDPHVDVLTSRADFLCCGLPCCLRDDGGGRYCTGTDDPSNACLHCTASSGGNNPGTPYGSSKSCDDGDPCTVDTVCDGAGSCGGGNPVNCSHLDSACTVGTCQAGVGCVATPTNEGGACADDGHACTSDTCDAGTCVHTVTTGCLIDGACQAEGATHGECQRCEAASSTTAWSLADEGTACGDAASCTDGVRTLADTCNASGQCVDSGTGDCGAYTICDANGIDCASSCSGEADCTSGATCVGDECVATRAQGESCTAGNQCASAICVDGVCCDDACGGVCESCLAADTAGADGTCLPVTGGTDPGMDCPDTGAGGCGTDGQCDGAGACRLYAAGTVCAAASCDGTDGLAPPSTCDGTGSCVAHGASTCAPGTCASGACTLHCTFDTDCATGAHCDGGSCSTANRAPIVTVMAPGSIASGGTFHLEATVTDPDGDATTFEWSQIAGPAVTISSTTALTPDVTAPTVSTATDIVLRLTASDGEATTTADATTIVQPPPTDSGGGSGESGGCASTSTELSPIALLGLVLWRRRRRGRFVSEAPAR